jgi:tripartite-type tricarboxylate transporter receptor subunit TctC
VIPFIRSGKLKAIAAPGQTRLSGLPEVPTFAEAGLPGFEVKSWIGVLAPAATPKAIVNKLSAEIGRIVAMPDTRDKLLKQEHEPMILDSEQFAAFIKSEMARIGKIVKTANIKIEN